MDRMSKWILSLAIPGVLTLIGFLAILSGLDVFIHELLGHYVYGLLHGADCSIQITKEGILTGGITYCQFPKGTPVSVLIEHSWAGLNAELLVSFILMMIPFYSVLGGMFFFDVGMDFHAGAYDSDLFNAQASEMFFSESFRLGVTIFSFIMMLLTMVITYLTWDWFIEKID